MTQTLTYKPTVPANLSKKPNILEARYGDGYVASARNGINNNPQTWSLTFDSVGETEAAAIEAFFDSVGSDEPFYWTPPGKSQLKFRAKDFTRSYNDEELNDIRVTLEQFYG